MKKLLLTLTILLIPVLSFSQSANPVSELSSQPIQKVSDTQFTQVKEIQVTYNYDQLLQTRKRLLDQVGKVNVMLTSLQDKLTALNTVLADMEKQGAKAQESSIMPNRVKSLKNK